MSLVHKFIFEGLPVRGMLVRLDDSWQELLRRRHEAGDSFPPAVQELMGEMAAAAVLMQSSIRFNGSLSIQVHGDGPVKLAVAEVQPDLAFRVTAKVIGTVPESARLEALLNVHGKGRCAITLSPKDTLPGQQPYQGVVPLHGDRREPLQNLSEVLEHYMLQSEQLDTRLILAADGSLAAGLLIQRLPMEGHANLQLPHHADEIGLNEAYNRISMLASTLTRDELLTLDPDTLLRRLFWEESVRRFEPLSARFACSCSRDRVASMLRSLGEPEIDSILAEQGRVEIGCDFCGLKYQFDPIDAGELFIAPSDHLPGSSAIN